MGLLVPLIVSGLWAAQAAPDREVPELRAALMTRPPTVDGEIHFEEWSGAPRMERFGAGPLLVPQEGSFWVGSDGRELFIAVLSETPPGGKLLSRVNPLPGDADARVWLDDSVEIVLDPLPEDKSGRRRIYHAAFNARGAISDTAFVPGGGGEAWRGHWRIGSRVIGD